MLENHKNHLSPESYPPSGFVGRGARLENKRIKGNYDFPHSKKEHVIEMKNISLILLFGTWLFSSCETREEKETRSLLQVVSLDVLGTKQYKAVFDDADNEWFTSWFGECSQLVFADLGNTPEADENQFQDLNKVLEPIMGKLPIDEVCRICEEAKKPFKFDHSMFLKEIILSSEKNRYDSIKNVFSNALKVIGSDTVSTEEFSVYLGIELSVFIGIEREFNAYNQYFKISKPIFIKNYEYALVYHYFIMEQSGLSVYKKVDGKWIYYSDTPIGMLI